VQIELGDCQVSPVREHSSRSVKQVNLIEIPANIKNKLEKERFNEILEPEKAQKRHFPNFSKEFHSQDAKDLIYSQ